MNSNYISGDASSLVALSGRDQSAALAAFNALDPKGQAALVRSALPEHKKELLFLARDLSGLFDRLHGRDVCLALESASASEFDVLIERIGPRHLSFMLAMGCFKNGGIDDARFIHWLDVLNNCDSSVSAAAISDIDADFLACALFPHLDVQSDESIDPEDNRGMSEAYSFTPEHCRFDNDAVEDFMERLFSIDKTLFALICYKRVFGNPDEILDNALHSYSRRLQEEGLPSYREAAEVYEKGWDILQNAKFLKPRTSSAAVEQVDNAELFLTAVLGAINDSGRGDPRLAGDFSGLLQKISVADGSAMDPDSRRRVVRKAEIYASLSLEHASKGNVEIAASLLLENGITPFFKAGFDMISNLRKAARQALEKAGEEYDPAAGDILMAQRAMLENATPELPRITMPNGKGRIVRRLREFEDLLKRVHELSE